MNDDIWFTYKSRIAAEVRLKNNDLHSQILLVWYAIASSAAAVVALRHERFAGPNTDIYTAILSIALLGCWIPPISDPRFPLNTDPLAL